jgi:hypothetical protein
MKRQVERRRVLGAYAIDMAELGLLWQKCLALVPDDGKTWSYLSVELPNEKLTFDSYEEFAAAEELPAKIYSYTLTVSASSGNRMTLWGSFMGAPRVTADGESEAWCAGAIETVAAFTYSHRTWYWWISKAPLLAMAAVLGIAGPIGALLAPFAMPKGTTLPFSINLGALTLAGALVLMFFARGNLFPPGAITVRKESSFLRRYTGELGLVVAALSLVVTVIGIVVSIQASGHK